MTRYVGVDLHRRRSVIVVLDADGTELWTKRIDNDPLTLGLEIEKAGPEPEVDLEATWGCLDQAVQRMLGHKNASMTLDVYGGLFEEDLETLADRWEAATPEVVKGDLI